MCQDARNFFRRVNSQRRSQPIRLAIPRQGHPKNTGEHVRSIFRRMCVAPLAVLALSPSPLAAQSYQAFGPRTSLDVVVPEFADQQVAELLGTLDRLLKGAPAGAAWREKAGDALWQFARRVQTGRLTRPQETRVLAHLDGIARSRPDAAAVVTGPRRMITSLTPGKPAPEIAGRDLEGKPFRLSEHRGKVVLVVFTAEWCAICRAQAPYERFLLDKYSRWPFALLGVDTGSSREAARLAHAASPVTHRTWWDEPRTGETGGPIASAWNVVGWPATYLIDGDGIIQFVDLREEDLLIAVRQLVETQVDRDAKASKTSRRK
jgi:peroxiredoxin